MTVNSCREKAKITKQMPAKNALVYTKDGELHVKVVIRSRSPLQKNEE